MSSWRARSRCSRRASRICEPRARSCRRPKRAFSDSSSARMVRSTPSMRVNDAPAAEWAVDRAAIDDALATLSERLPSDIEPPVGEAIRYSLLGGGKRLRGLLFLAAYRTAGGAHDAKGLAAAIEVVHAYSLVHDDLPCMDDDDMRRGRATVHRVFGVR